MSRCFSRPLFFSLLLITGCSSFPKHTGKAEAIEEALVSHRNEFASCYEKSKTKNTGRINTQFAVTASGTPSEIKILETTLHDRETEQCVLGTIMSIKFPSSSAGETAQVTYPFKFTGKKGE